MGVTHVAGPQAYLLRTKPDGRHVRFGGRYINLSELSASEGLSHGYLTRVISGERTPSLTYLKRVAEALGMELADFLDAVEVLKSEKLEKALKRVS